MALVAEADVECHFANTAVFGEKQFASTFQAPTQDILLGCHAGGSFEHAREVKHAEPGGRSHIFERNGFVEVLANVIADAPKLERGQAVRAVSQQRTGSGVFPDNVHGHPDCYRLTVSATAQVILFRFCQKRADTLGQIAVLDRQLKRQFDAFTLDKLTGGLMKELRVDLHENEITGLGSANGKTGAGRNDAHSSRSEAAFRPILAVEFPVLRLAVRQLQSNDVMSDKDVRQFVSGAGVLFEQNPAPWSNGARKLGVSRNGGSFLSCL